MYWLIEAMYIEIFSLKTYIKHLKFSPVFLIQFSSSSNIIMQNWRYFSREYLEINESRDPPSKYEIDQFNTKKFHFKEIFLGYDSYYKSWEIKMSFCLVNV